MATKHMEKVVQTIYVPLGFIIASSILKVDYCSAERILGSRRKRKYTYAKKEDDYIYLIQHFYVCPYCGNRIPVYEQNAITLPKCVVEDFCDNQLSLFEENRLQSLTLNKTAMKIIRKIVPDRTVFSCPHCADTSSFSTQTREYKLSYDDKVLQISCEITDIGELLHLSWASDWQMNLSSFVIKEVVRFDFSTGKVEAFLYDGDDLVFSKIIPNPDIFSEQDPCVTAFRCIQIRRSVKKAYETISSAKCPFQEKNLSLSKLFLLTHFVGYDQAFYDAIPFAYNASPDEDFMDASFEEVSKKIHSASEVPENYTSFYLPQCKSVRKTIFTKPQLLFYVKELEGLWEVIPDPNYYCKLLNNDRIFSHLSINHRYEKLKDYYIMLKEVKGVAYLYKQLENNLLDEYFYEYEGLEYCSMNDIEKEKMRRSYETGSERASFSLPTCHSQQSISDCNIDGYNFVRLRSSIDCYYVGKALKNCLVGYGPANKPVFGVQFKNQYVAALELDNNYIIQARIKNNEEIDPESKLGQAIQKWRLRFKLK